MVVKEMGTCVICGSPSKGMALNCPRCLKLTRFAPSIPKQLALVAALDKTINKFRCYYTNIILEENDPKSPFAITFDHPIPGDLTRVVACAAFINELKSAMTESEFRANIPLLASHFEGALVLDRNNFKIANFHPHPPRVRAPLEPVDRRPKLLRWFSETCKICGKPPMKRGFYCLRCHNLLRSQIGRAAKEASLIAAYDKTVDGFRCRYTGMIVDDCNPPGPYHINFDHRHPGHPGTFDVCLFIINLMKSALSDAEFIIIVKQLAKHFTTGEPFDLGGVKFEYWR